MNTNPDQTKTDPAAPSQTPSFTVDPLVIRTSQNVIPPIPKPPPENPLPSTLPAVPAALLINSTLAPPVKPPTTPPPFTLHSEKPSNKSLKFPIVVTGLFFIISVLGFGGSVIYFGFINKPSKKIATNLTTVSPPLVNIPSPTIQPPANIFITPSISFQNLFSTDVFASDNPFDETTNPFTGVTTDDIQDSDAYQNPFEGQP